MDKTKKKLVTWSSYENPYNSKFNDYRGKMGYVDCFIVFRFSSKHKDDKKWGVNAIYEPNTHYFPTLEKAKRWSEGKAVLMLFRDSSILENYGFKI